MAGKASTQVRKTTTRKPSPVKAKVIETTGGTRTVKEQVAVLLEKHTASAHKFAPPMGNQGAFQTIPISKLCVDPIYQRDENLVKAEKLAEAWDWRAAGTINVSRRKDGTYFVFDGQTRAMAAMLRGIKTIPAIVFKMDAHEEAGSFVKINQLRTHLSGFELFKAELEWGDEAAQALHDMFEKTGLKLVKSATGPKQIQILSKLKDYYRHGHGEPIEQALQIISEMNCKVSDILFGGIYYIYRHVVPTLNAPDQQKLRDRLLKIGPVSLERKASDARAFLTHVKGGAKAYAYGMMQEVNYKLKKRFPTVFSFESDEGEDTEAVRPTG